MHRLAVTPGGWTPTTEGVIFVEQTPAPIVVITAQDTDINAIAQALPLLPEGFPAVRVVNLLQLQQQLSIDTYAEQVLAKAQVILLRLLGGRAYWSYGLEVVCETVARTEATLIVLPGDAQPDPNLISHSTLAPEVIQLGWQYFLEGGIANMGQALRWAAHVGIDPSYSYAPAQPVPAIGIYDWRPGQMEPDREGALHAPLREKMGDAGILFYRAHYLAGNLAPIDALCQALHQRGVQPLPIFVSSLRDPQVQAQLREYGREGMQILLNTTSFSLGQPLSLNTFDPETDTATLWQALDLPVLQVILSGDGQPSWQQEWRGLSPRDVAMNVALPEVDGRIISRAISFKGGQGWHSELETEVVNYQPVQDRVDFVADLAANWAKLRQQPPALRRVALILANYPTRNGRLANGVGLDTPASCVAILAALEQAGYQVENPPATAQDLIERLTAGITNDPETQINPVGQTLSLVDYQAWFATLPTLVQTAVVERWGPPQPKEVSLSGGRTAGFAIPGILLGNVFVGIQPARGYDLDPALNYHAPDLEPSHDYLAFYAWLRLGSGIGFGMNAVVHIGKHGNLEWLPGKSVALSETCYPEVALGSIPNLYPFIVNDPGEGSQAKRRSHAVIIDHLTPPMTRAELYGGLQQLEGLIDEYYDAQTLDPSRLPIIRQRIGNLIESQNLSAELPVFQSGNLAESESPPPVGDLGGKDLAELITHADRYLCELKESQIRDGLHIFGSCPTGNQLRDLIVSIARHPGRGRLGLTRALAKAWQLGFDPLLDDPAQAYTGATPPDWPTTTRNLGEAVDLLENLAAQQVEQLLTGGQLPATSDPDLRIEWVWIRDGLIPNLRQTDQEILNLLHGLNGGYVPSGPSGAPTRGRPEVLPTGKNFYGVDIRAVPTESAWDVGRKAAETLIETYTQTHGEYPQTLALSVWGTATMRTGGDDLAEALALLGVQPVWEGASRRVIDFEILPLSLLGRPRVDVTLRISGFFRDAFPNLIDLFDQAVVAVAALPESPEQNPLAAKVQAETKTWLAEGLSAEQAQRRAVHRVFGSKPGAYGAGLQGLIESQNWQTTEDLARAYMNWSSYAYSAQGAGNLEPEAFQQRLGQLQIVLQNQDNREHDLLDSDDYYQFQGGLTAAAKAIQGQNPVVYFGDNALPEQPKVRSLQQEIARVYRSRVVNPKWIAGAMRHGYKGAFEMAATLDFLFAYDATTGCVADYMYKGVAEAYLLDPEVQAFIQAHNPWALRDMTERLLEANQRGLWQEAEPELLEQLRALSLAAEAEVEGRLGSG